MERTIRTRCSGSSRISSGDSFAVVSSILETSLEEESAPHAQVFTILTSAYARRWVKVQCSGDLKDRFYPFLAAFDEQAALALECSYDFWKGSASLSSVLMLV